MRYYVLADDGNRYGPADLATLNQWIVDHRLLPHQMLEEEASGVRIAAQAVAGLNFPAAQPAGPTAGPTDQAYSGYYRGPNTVSAADDGSREVTAAWVLFGVGISIGCCFVQWGGFLIPVAGIYFGAQARKKGHPQGNLVFALNIGVTTLEVILLIVGLVFLSMFKGGAFPIPQNTR